MPPRRSRGEELLAFPAGHLRAGEFLSGGRYTIADIAVDGYTQVAPDAGYDLGRYPAVEEWLRCVERQPGFVDDLEPYPANARLGAGSSICG